MKNFLDKYRDSFSIEEYGDGVLLHTPVMYRGADHTFSFYLVKRESGSFVISDRGRTLSYMRENFDPRKYADKIASVCESFGITESDGELYGILPSYESGQTMRALHAFMGAMYIIANIDTLA